MDGSAVHFVEPDSGLHWFSSPEVAITHALNWVENSCNFLPKHRVLIGYHKPLWPIDVQIFVFLINGVAAIHLLVTALLPLIANDIYGRIRTSKVALLRYRALIIQHVRVMIPGVHDACLGPRGIANYHESWQMTGSAVMFKIQT